MRLLHTSDWHLGHTLHDHGRDYEHARFLEWLLQTLEAERVDALIVAGDVFDTANPPAAAQAAYYRFLAAARTRLPGLQVVVIGGNHDSSSRLDAPREVLTALDVHVVGGMARGRAADLVLPLRNSTGEVAAWIAAVPYLRMAELEPDAEAADCLVDGVRRAYAQAIDAARERRSPGQALLATGHCYMAGGALSEASERKIQGGNQSPLPADIFPDDVAYAALGHLHLAQRVGSREHVRYSGSPIPLSMGEASYPHQAVLVELDGERAASVTPLRIPRTVDMLRLPGGEPQAPEEVMKLLEELPKRVPGDERTRWPFLEIHALLPAPDPTLRARIETVLDTRAARLVAIRTHYTGHGQALADTTPAVALRELSPEVVFEQRYRRDHDGDPAPALMAAFHELMETMA